MNSKEIFHLMCSDHHIKKIFYGVFPRDKLPKKIYKKPGIFIINTDSSDKIGEHWVAIYLDVNGRAEYFDSYAIPPRSNDIKSFIKKNSNFCKYNTKVLQPVFSDTCGYFVFYYAYRKARGFKMQNIVSKLRMYKPNLNNTVVTNFSKHFLRK